MVDKKLIDKFFENRCTAEEAAAVVDHFNKYPQELENYLPEEDWEDFSTKAHLPKMISDRMFKQIQKETTKLPSRPKYIALSVAASVVICLFVFGQLYFKNKNETTPQITRTNKSLQTPVPSDFITKVNRQQKNIEIKLEDGSVVELSPGGMVRYPRSYRNQTERHIHLEGEALFKVAKDKTKPFTVFAGGISTTALGTSFSVIAGKADEKIKVNLYTGRVVVKAVAKKFKGKMKDVYLSPGQGFSLDRVRFTTSIQKLSNSGKTAHPGSVTINGNVIEFKGLPLAGVFDQLATIYKVKITYSHADFSKTYFTGKVDKTDPLANTLNTLGILNDFKIIKVGDGYMIKNNDE